jgi:hypothetical protein
MHGSSGLSVATVTLRIEMNPAEHAEINRDAMGGRCPYRATTVLGRTSQAVRTPLIQARRQT